MFTGDLCCPHSEELLPDGWVVHAVSPRLWAFCLLHERKKPIVKERLHLRGLFSSTLTASMSCVRLALIKVARKRRLWEASIANGMTGKSAVYMGQHFAQHSQDVYFTSCSSFGMEPFLLSRKVSMYLYGPHDRAQPHQENGHAMLIKVPTFSALRRPCL